MTTETFLRPFLITAAVGSLVFACGSPVGDDVVLGTRDDAGIAPFTPPDAGTDDAAVSIPLCLATECPAPYGTCPTSAFKCDVDLTSDDQNCGRCGNVCPTHEPIHLAMHCQNGVCVGRCDGTVKDCNGILDDGCEAFVKEDPNNCGACGNRCPAGTPCLDGVCGCVPPKVLCNGACVDTSEDFLNCGACGNACGPPPGAPPAPPNMGYGCSGSTCGIGCNEGWADCDNDFATLGYASNGCEVSLHSAENCGGCGIKCGPGQRCLGGCVGGPSETDCGELPGFKNLLTDPLNCGGCGIECPGESIAGLVTHARAACRSGACSITCDPGFGDCDADPVNGCETDLAKDPNHCGACDHACEGSAGQPCVRGVCLTKPCGQGPTQ